MKKWVRCNLRWGASNTTKAIRTRLNTCELAVLAVTKLINLNIITIAF